MSGDDDLLAAWGYRPDKPVEPPPEIPSDEEKAERARRGPGGHIDLQFLEKRGLIASLIFIGVYGIFTGVQTVAFLFFTDVSNMNPSMAGRSVLINISVLAVFMTLLSMLAVVRARRGKPSRRLTTWSLHLAIVTIFSATLVHMHLAGTQHTFLPLANLGIGLVSVWLLGMRVSWIYYSVFSAGFLAVSLLEWGGVLPYAPLFDYGAELRERFSDGYFITFNFILYCTVSLIVMLAIGLFERDRERRAEQLRRATDEARQALSHIHELQQLIPMCSSCKKVRNDAGFWRDVSHYINESGQGMVSHGICPDCMARLYPDLADPPDSGPVI